MNTAEITNTIHGVEEFEARIATGLGARRHTKARVNRERWQRLASFAVTVALLVGLTFVMQEQMSGLQTQMDAIMAQLNQPSF